MANPEVCRVVSNSNVFEIIRPEKGDVINIEVRQNRQTKRIIASLTSLPSGEEDKLKRLRAEIGFSDTVQRYITASLDTSADKLAGGSEDMSAAARLVDAGISFQQATSRLKAMKYQPSRLYQLIIDAARQNRGGEIHMGIMPPVVAKQVESLKQSVTDLYLKGVNTQH